MDDAWSSLISRAHDSGRQAVLAITGGGTGAIADLLRIPGGSRLLLEAVVPYDAGALARFLDAVPAQASSADTAVAMAARALDRAVALGRLDGEPIGLGATASLASDRPKRGDHRCHVAVATAAGTELTSVTLDKGRRTRAAEEDVAARAILLCLARGCGVSVPPVESLLAGEDRCARESFAAVSLVDRLLAGAIARATARPNGRLTASAPTPIAVMPGSFNPCHEGHLRLAEVAGDVLGAPVHFEISVLNVDKPPLAADDVRRRLAQFAGRAAVELTRAPTFLEKSRLFPGATFVIGADTAERLVAVRYYDGSEVRMHAALAEMAARGARFLVAVRRDASGRLRRLADARVPESFSPLFAEIPEERFRVDISSTEIRARA